MDRSTIIAGLGWIAAGIVSLAAWAIKSQPAICNCPAQIIGQVSHPCVCGSPAGSAAGLAYIGVLTLILGFAILLSSKQIEKLKRTMMRKKR